MKFRKKPIVIDAIQFNGTLESARKISKEFGISQNEYGYAVVDRTMWIIALEGKELATAGYWIIRGIQGECYPCAPGIFDLTYEKVEEVNHDHDCKICGAPEEQVDDHWVCFNEDNHEEKL